MADYVPTIGLEVHAELDTRTKLFCGCATAFGSPPNSQVCPVCIGMPGTLPVMNGLALELALRAALALNCRIATRTAFDRKNYYYPDLPKNYQISQNHANLGVDGFLEMDVAGEARRVRISNVHLEEDAGKSLHPEGAGDGRTMIDLNRAGVPLLEIVSQPDMHSVEEATVYMHAVRGILLYLGVSTCRMEQGALRFEASISLAAPGSPRLGNRIEIKNLNSMKAVQKALDYEIERQTSLLTDGREIPSETLLWNEALGRSEPMRRKEVAQDYRYFPEPDLVPAILSGDRIERCRAGLPELPLARRRRFVSQHGLPDYDAGVLTQDTNVAEYFEIVAVSCGDAKAASNWVMTNVLSDLKQHSIAMAEFARKLPPQSLAAIIRFVAAGTTNIVGAREIYAEASASGRPPDDILKEKGLVQINDATELEAAVRQVLRDNPQALADFRAGKKQAAGFLMGQIMRRTRGQANPSAVNDILRESLEREEG